LLDGVCLGLDEGEGHIRMLRDELGVDVLEGELLSDTLLIVLFREKWFENRTHSLSDIEQREADSGPTHEAIDQWSLRSLREDPSVAVWNDCSLTKKSNKRPVRRQRDRETERGWATHLLPLHEVQRVV
jgi:hypothetical protein